MPIPTHEVHELNVPVTQQGREYTELRIRRPKARDLLLGAKLSSQNSALEINARQMMDLCEVPREVIDELDISDFLAVQTIMAAFQRPTEAELRKAIMVISTHVGWDLDTLEDRPVDDIIEWLKTLEAIKSR